MTQDDMIRPHGEPEQVFHVGRTVATGMIIVAGMAFTGAGVWFLLTAHLERDPRPVIALAAPALVGGIVGAVGGIMAFCRSAVTVYFEGVLFTNWYGPPRFIPWSDVQGMARVEYRHRVDSEAWYLYLLTRSPAGGTLRLKVARADTKRALDRIISAVVRRANLEYSERRSLPSFRQTTEVSWRKRRSVP